MNEAVVYMGGTVASICAIGVFANGLAISLRAKRIAAGSNTGGWFFAVDFVGLAAVAWDVACGPVRVQATARGLPHDIVRA